jgi:uncharacterized protein
MSCPSYQPSSDLLPLSDAELDKLDSLLAPLPDAMNVEALDGFLTALLLAPKPLAELAGDDWLPVVWGGDDPFPSSKQRKNLQLLVLRHTRALDTALRGPAWEPLFSVIEGEDGEEFIDAEDWCCGFMLGVDLDGEGWAARFDDAETGPLLAPIALLGGDPEQQDPEALASLDDPAVRDQLAREVHQGVVRLARDT